LSKRICVVTSHIPFARGGHLVLTEELVRQLEIHGYKAELIRTPQHMFNKQFSAYRANLLFDLTETAYGEKIDGIITTRFPSFALKHERHACWLFHRIREYYDLWPKFVERLSGRAIWKERVKRFLFHKLDEYCLEHRVHRLYCLSKTVKARLSTWGGHTAEELYAPPMAGNYRTEDYGRYIFGVSRVIDHKRMDLLVKAAIHKKVPLKIAGEGPDIPLLKRLIKDANAESYIELLGYTTRDELLHHYANCRAVAFPTFNEDYGLITVEAFASGKAVLTLTDSGGPAELVENEQTGFVVEPDVEKYGNALNMIFEDRELAERMGQRALQRSEDFTWQNIIDKLVEWK